MIPPPSSFGSLDRSAIANSLIDETIEFIWDSLEPWQCDPERSTEQAEEALNEQFHNFLESRRSEQFPMVYFQLEQRQGGGRRVDLSVKPTALTLIEGRVYSKYQPFLVIEGKRLPSPARSREREYVTGEDRISGGIQRFKLGVHGKDQKTAIILGYLQEGAPCDWHSRIDAWIAELATSDPENWNLKEQLFEFQESVSRARSLSIHPRPNDCTSPEIKLLHFWVLCT